MVVLLILLAVGIDDGSVLKPHCGGGLSVADQI